MKEIIKRILKHILRVFFLYGIARQCLDLLWMCRHHSDSLFHVLRYRVVMDKRKVSRTRNYVEQMEKVFRAVRVDTSGRFIYPYDSRVTRSIPDGCWALASITPDFGRIISSSLADLEEQLSHCTDGEFKAVELGMIKAVRLLHGRIIRNITSRTDSLADYFRRMLDEPPSTMEEAMQKLLFYHALFYQARHWHIGFGRLDKILHPYFEADFRAGRLNPATAKETIKEFCRMIHRDMEAKSLELKGDTGAYILLGGTNGQGGNVENELTELFLEAIGELGIPDPKLILRVNAATGHAVWQKAISCIKTGCGSPLLMNEEIIMRNMVEFGYRADDVSEVGTSACWEPLVIGKSFDQNNPLPSIIAVKPVNDMILAGREYASFGDFLAEYEKRLSRAVRETARDIDFDCSPLFSLFMDDCLAKEKDFAAGGARYAYHGLQVLSLPNAVNSLFNLSRFVFGERVFTLDDCRDAIARDFADHQDMLEAFHRNPLQFGSDDDEVVGLANELIGVIAQAAGSCRVNGEKIKIGLSSPGFVQEGSRYAATLDGRRARAPFNVHISPLSERIGIREICAFAARLHYPSTLLNGNVVDFILPTAFAREPEKMETILRNGMHDGIFELQLGMLDAETLKDALVHPERHRDLIVRVWGFSAYFNDLPESYKMNLIHRAEIHAA